MVFCGIDIGTTSTKAVALGPDNELLGTVTIRSRSSGASAGQAGVSWYDHFCRVFDYFSSQGHFSGEAVFCSVTGQGGSFVLLNEGLEPISRVHSWTETAGSDVVEGLIEAFGARRYYRMTGWPAHGWLGACRLRELIDRKEMPKDVRFVATVPDFVYSQIAGRLVTDITSAQITGMADFEKGQWSPEILEWIGIRDRLLAPIRPGPSILFGDVPSKWGKVTFVTGSHDQYAAMEAVGLEKDKCVMLGTGTAWVINGRSSGAVLDDVNFLIHPGRDLYEDCYGYIITLWQIGAGLERLLERFGVGMEALGRIETNFAEDDLPRQSIRVDISSGAIEPEFDVELAVRRYMEWAASMVAYVLEEAKRREGLDRIVITGGAMSSRFWPQVIADLCNLSVEAVDFPELTAYGAALHAMSAVMGEARPNGLPEAIRSRSYVPRRSGPYQEWYRTFQKPVLKSQSY